MLKKLCAVLLTLALLMSSCMAFAESGDTAVVKDFGGITL